MENNVLLLDKTRKIQTLFQENSTGKVDFDDICRSMRDVTDSNCLIFSRKGKILGTSLAGHIPVITELIGGRKGEFIDEDLNNRLLGVLSTRENLNLHALGFTETDPAAYHVMVTPSRITGARHGTLFLYRKEQEYDVDDIILCEYVTTLVGLEIIRAENDETIRENRKIFEAHAAVSTLSGTELEAIIRIVEELKGQEGILVAGKVADREGISRSIIVTGLRKLENAGVIETKSAGMKGTCIRFLNDAFLEEIAGAKNKNTSLSE